MPRFNSIREAIIGIGERGAAKGLFTGSHGNISVRTDDGFLVTQTGKHLGFLSGNEILSVDQDGKVSYADCSEERHPSGEWTVHQILYREVKTLRESGAIIHFHGPEAVKYAERAPGIGYGHPLVTDSNIYQFEGLDLGSIFLAPASLPGTLDISDIDFDRTRGIIVRGHGTFVWAGGDVIPALLQAYGGTETIEKLCEFHRERELKPQCIDEDVVASTIGMYRGALIDPRRP